MTETFRVEITGSAEQDIEEIWDYISCDNTEDAYEFIRNLEAQILTLESYPFRCPVVPENELLGTSYRHMLYNKYRIIFRIIGYQVIIMRVIHQSRLLETALLKD